jgi:hypothetical protein
MYKSNYSPVGPPEPVDAQERGAVACETLPDQFGFSLQIHICWSSSKSVMHNVTIVEHWLTPKQSLICTQNDANSAPDDWHPTKVRSGIASRAAAPLHVDPIVEPPKSSQTLLKQP